MSDAEKSSVEQVAQPQIEIDDSRSLSYHLIALVCILSIVIGCIAAYHAMWGKKQRTAVVDIAGVLETTEMVFTEMLAKPNVSDDDRKRAYELVSQTGPRIEASIKQIQKDCDCLILAKAAVIGAGAPDYTDQLKSDLGILDVDVAELKRRLQESMSGKRDGVKN